MPRFFFNIRDGMDAVDLEGMELPDLDAARAVAIQSARSIMSETIMREGSIPFHERIEIENLRRAVVATVWFEDAVQIEHGHQEKPLPKFKGMG